MFDVDRLAIKDPPIEVLTLLERIEALLEKIEKNTAKRKPGRPRKEQSRA